MEDTIWIPIVSGLTKLIDELKREMLASIGDLDKFNKLCDRAEKCRALSIKNVEMMEDVFGKGWRYLL